MTMQTDGRRRQNRTALTATGIVSVLSVLALFIGVLVAQYRWYGIKWAESTFRAAVSRGGARISVFRPSELRALERTLRRSVSDAYREQLRRHGFAVRLGQINWSVRADFVPRSDGSLSVSLEARQPSRKVVRHWDLILRAKSDSISRIRKFGQEVGRELWLFQVSPTPEGEGSG